LAPRSSVLRIGCYAEPAVQAPHGLDVTAVHLRNTERDKDSVGLLEVYGAVFVPDVEVCAELITAPVRLIQRITVGSHVDARLLMGISFHIRRLIKRD